MPAPNQPTPPRNLNKYAWGLLAISAFMFISIIVKTAMQGP